MKGKELVARYQKIWDEFEHSPINNETESHSDKLLDRGFVFQFDEEIINPDILFIGINPSYKREKEKPTFYTKSQVLDHAYFKPFFKIEHQLKNRYQRKISWTHLDLLVFRETQQSFIKKDLFKKNNSEGIKFLYDQLMVSKSILAYYNPKVVVVANSLARLFLGYERVKKAGNEHNVWMDYLFEFNTEMGTLKMKDLTNKNCNPHCFLTSMLSGQRALDIGSRERLVWHIDYVLSKLDY